MFEWQCGWWFWVVLCGWVLVGWEVGWVDGGCWFAFCFASWSFVSFYFGYPLHVVAWLCLRGVVALLVCFATVGVLCLLGWVGVFVALDSFVAFGVWESADFWG